MTTPSTNRRTSSPPSAAADARRLLQSISSERHWTAVLFSRHGEDQAKRGSSPALLGGFVSRVLATWRALEPASKSPPGAYPMLFVVGRFASRRWDSPAVRDRLEEVLQAFFRGEQPLPGVHPKVAIDWCRLKTAKEVDAVRRRLKAKRHMAEQPPSSASPEKRERQSPLEAVQELVHIVATLESVKTPLRRRLQQVLNGLAGQTLDSAELNAQVVKQINALRTALSVGLRLKDSGDPIYLRCVVAPRARSATIQAVTADQERKNLEAAPSYPALEVFEPEENS